MLNGRNNTARKNSRLPLWIPPSIIGAVSLSVLAGCMEANSDRTSWVGEFDSELSTPSDEPPDAGIEVDDIFVPLPIDDGEGLDHRIRPATSETSNVDMCAVGTEAAYLLSESSTTAAGPALARDSLVAGTIPVTSIRDIEFLNYYMSSAAPETDTDDAAEAAPIHAEIARVALAEETTVGADALLLSIAATSTDALIFTASLKSSGR